MRGVRPRDFEMFPAPDRGAALQVQRLFVEELIAHGAVDGAVGHAVDGLVDAWLEQWLQELQPGLAARQALLQRLTGLAEARLAAARGRAEDAALAHELAREAYLAATEHPSGAATRPSVAKETTNGATGVALPLTRR